MNQASRTRLTRLYRQSLFRHGPTARGLQWSSESSQLERFELLSRIGGWERRSVADVGCGVGDLLGFLRRRGWRGRRYHGFDLVPEMVEAARAKQRDPHARFEVRDVLREGFPGTYDYVLASGTFALRVDDHDRYFRRLVRAMWAACRRGVAFNVLLPIPADDRRWGRFDTLFRGSFWSIDAGALRAFGARLTPHVELIEAPALPYEATVLLRRSA